MKPQQQKLYHSPLVKLDVPEVKISKLGFDTSLRKKTTTFIDENLKDNSRPLKIAQIAAPWISVPPKDYGGTEAVISNLTEELVKQGHDVTLFASGDSQTSAELRSYINQALYDAGVPWDNHIEADFHMINSFREIANNPEKYDIVHTHLSSGSDLLLFKLAAQLPIPHICTLHSRFLFDRRDHHFGKGDNYYFSWAENTPMIAISNRALEDALLESGLPLNFMGVVPHGLPDDQFLQGKATERSHLAWVGKICKNKGTRYAIEAAVKAKRKIIVAGVVDAFVPDSGEYFRNEVLPLIEKYPEYVEYIGPVNNSQRVKLLRGALCFLNPIQWEEPFGLVMIEAMASGCPVISFPRGAAQELIKPGINGQFANSVDEMAAMIEAVGNNINREKMVQDTWNNYSVTRMTKNYVRKYREVIHAASANAQKVVALQR